MLPALSIKDLETFLNGHDLRNIRLSGEWELQPPGQKAILVKNLITESGRDSIVQMMIPAGTAYYWSYVGVGFGTTAPGSTDTNLETEIWRTPIIGRWQAGPGTLRMVGIVHPDQGVGNWKEVGIFDYLPKRQAISLCEGTAGWYSDGILSVTDASGYVREGKYAITTLMYPADEIAFRHTGAISSEGVPDEYFGSADYLQFWYRAGGTPPGGTVKIVVGNDDANYYRFIWVVTSGTVSDWAFFNRQFASADSKVGTPNGLLPYFVLSHDPFDVLTQEWLDFVSMFGHWGNLLARGTCDVNKGYNQAMNVLYTLKIQD